MALVTINDKCYTCGKNSNFSILLARTNGRIYLPNQAVRREAQDYGDGYGEISFCKDCMRAIEDSLRATILYLQTENNITPPTEP